MASDDAAAASILIVDDDETVRKVLRRMLETAGYQVSEAENGKLAMAGFRDRRVDLLITDLFMPEQEGMETINLTRRQYPHLKIIAMSGKAGPVYLKMARLLGAQATLEKPLRLETVLDTVRDVLARAPL